MSEEQGGCLKGHSPRDWLGRACPELLFGVELEASDLLGAETAMGLIPAPPLDAG